jgi:hypothetical protein
MENKVKILFKEYGALSPAFLQRKFKISFEYSRDLLENIKIKNSKKVYLNYSLIRLIKTTSDNHDYIPFE